MEKENDIEIIKFPVILVCEVALKLMDFIRFKKFIHNLDP